MNTPVVNEVIVKGICNVQGCRNKPDGRKFCATHRSTFSRIKDPIKYVFHNIRNRAKQRPKEFTITLEQFREWCIKEDFQPGRGDSVDRIKNHLGYHIDNIQKLDIIENINKYHEEDKFVPFLTDENSF